MKKLFALLLCMGVVLAGCSTSNKTDEKKEDKKEEKVEKVTLKIAAAASLENAFEEELIQLYQKDHKNVEIVGVYDASGKLQTQIEEGLDADIFMSAATKQMVALDEKGMIKENTKTELLENKIVLIKSKDTKTDVTSFETIDKANTIALGDPASVPVGQYSQEALTSLNLWDAIQGKVSLATNVTEVLNWVSEASAEVGIVYATDAASNDNVEIIAEAPAGSLTTKVMYPVAVIKDSKHTKEAEEFVKFLSSKEALAIFEKYGFTPNK